VWRVDGANGVRCRGGCERWVWVGVGGERVRIRMCVCKGVHAEYACMSVRACAPYGLQPARRTPASAGSHTLTLSTHARTHTFSHTHTSSLSPQAGPDGIVHVLMTSQDMRVRRTDTFMRDLPGATHLLDLYSRKRVDKRKARGGLGGWKWGGCVYVCACACACVCLRTCVCKCEERGG